MKNVIIATATAAALTWVAFTASGCGGCGYDENKVIVTIGDKGSVTVGDFVYHYKRAVEMAPPQDKPVINTFDDAKDFLDDIIISRVLELEAEKLGYGDDEQLKKDVETYRSNLLRERARTKIEDTIKVTEAEILDFYNKNKEWRRVSFLMCDKKDQAEKARAELDAGKPWNDVVKKYSIFEQNKDQGGVVPEDFYYSGDNVSRAVYETEVGKYTPVIEVESGDMWLVFRVDKKVPGQKDEYAQVKDGIRNSIKGHKLNIKMTEHVAKLREDAGVEVNREAYDAVIKGKLADAKEKYNRKKQAISTVGGVPVYFESWFEGMPLQFGMSEEMLDEFKSKQPEEFKKVMDDRLKALEDDALLEFDAIRSGADKEADFIRDLNRFRAGKMVDRIYDEVFVPTIPEVTEAEIKEYFENHKDEFQDLERADVEFVAMPKKAEAEAVRAKVMTGEDFMAASGEYAEKYFKELEKKVEPGQEPPRSEMPMADFFSVPKEPGAPEPTAPMGPEGGVAPLVDEIRPRVFKAKKGDVSEVFKLKDGRYAFFRYVEYSPFVQHTLDEKEYYERADQGAYREKLASPEVDRKCQAWFEELRGKFTIEIDEGALKMAYKKVQKL
jgi:peptidyl-prolyl cis-trans isomerase C